MFAIMPTPIFPFAASQSTSTATPLQSKYRPSVSSPLSSSPIRASSYSPPPPLSPRDTNISIFPQQHKQQLPRDTQSSPIAQPSPTRKLFKFATRTPRPNPVVQKREEARESRRKLFLKNVRDRGDDKAWERRGGDQEALKLEWWRLTNEIRRAKESELAVFGTDADIEDALQLQESVRRQEPEQQQQHADGIDEMMVDSIAREEEAEMEALLSSMPPADTDMDDGAGERRPESPHFSDEDDYDALFMEFVSQQEEMAGSQNMEMS